MTITKKTVADQIAAYLQHRITLAQLVDWAEGAVMDGQFEATDASALAKITGRLGASGVRAFGLMWEDCEQLLRQLGYSSRVEVVAA